jgi:hypothetical protein
MQKLKVYSSEKFDRNQLWYIVFSSVFIAIFAISIFYKNIVWAILMFFLLGWYLYYGIINIQETIMEITENWLIIWEKIINWSNFQWYSLEIEPNSQIIKNIILISKKHHNIYTINDDNEEIKAFLQQISDILPMIWEFPQTFREKASRKMKL